MDNTHHTLTIGRLTAGRMARTKSGFAQVRYERARIVASTHFTSGEVVGRRNTGGDPVVEEGEDLQ